VSVVILLVRVAAVRVGFLLGRLRSSDGDVVLATSHSGVLTGNLAVIRAALARHPAIQVRTLASVPSRSSLGLARALVASIVAGYRLARARVFVVDDYFFPLYAVTPRRGTTVVQTWHACGALKKMGYSVRDRTFGANAQVVDLVPIHTHYDVCLVSSAKATPSYAEAFNERRDVFVSELGIPRTDGLVVPGAAVAAREAVRRRHGLPDGARLVLWAPTFRGDDAIEARAGETLDLALLASVLAEGHLLLVRLHPFVRARLVVPDAAARFVVDVSDDPSINELMLASDALVTDYSSAVFEFALLARPIGLFAPDLAAYERERGFYVDYRTAMPGPIFDATAPLARWLRDGEFDLERVRAFAAEWFDVADGRATERFVDRVVLPAVAGRTVTAASLRAG
jgi:teichoic acid ribitol-phosphate primase